MQSDPESYLLDDTAIENDLVILRSGGEYSPLASIQTTLPDLHSIESSVNHLLEATATNTAIEKLKDNPSLQVWLQRGLALHQGKTQCSFCGNELTEVRLAELKGHFSESYNKLQEDIQYLQEKLGSLSFEVSLPDEARILPNKRNSYSDAKLKLLEWCQWAIHMRDELVNKLEQKKSSLESSTKSKLDLSQAPDGSYYLTKCNEAISEHNAVINDLENRSHAAKTRIERHYTAEYYTDNKVKDKEADIRELESRAKRVRVLQGRVYDRINAVNDQIRSSSIAISRLDGLVRYLLSGSNIRVEKVSDSKFMFIRGDKPAENLSDGERTALTFAYFMISLEAEGTIPDQTIIFIDDPISSLDSNHLYAVYGLISESLDEFAQIFISTHNSEFFNLFRGKWLGPNGGDNANGRAYLIYRLHDANGENPSRIESMPLLLRKYKSEYEFIFSKLYVFSESLNPTDYESYPIPNLLRKLLEAYLGFRRPSAKSWDTKLDLLFDTQAERIEISKFAHDGSHLQSLDRCLFQPGFSVSAQKCVKAVMKALQSRDQGHFDSLVSIALQR